MCQALEPGTENTMCGRYRIPTRAEVTAALGIDTNSMVACPPIATPGTVVPVVIAMGNQMVAENAIFGYPRGDTFTPNARVETWQQLAFWRGSRPCVIPALGWAERGVWISGERVQVLPFAGIMRDSHCAILTMNSFPGVRDIHARQPVVLPIGGVPGWLASKTIAMYSDFKIWV
jgi:putative SOS response-associated peptidase YedK